MIDLELHKRLEVEATVEPWVDLFGGEPLQIGNRPALMAVADFRRFEDVSLVLAMRNDHAAMIAEIEHLRRQRDELHAANNRLLEERRTAELVPFLIEKAQWSLATFGPGARTKGICAHIRKELAEIEAEPLDLEEWIDVFLLATDGYWRAWVAKHGQAWERDRNSQSMMLDMALDFIRDIRAKQAKNTARTWPVAVSENLPTEHTR